MRISYCHECDYYQEGRTEQCPQCDGPMERRDFNYPEDAFGPPEPGDWRRRFKTRARASGSTGAGLGLLVLLHLLQFPMSALSEGISFLLIGVSQGLYVIPALVILAVKGKTTTAGGVAIGAAVTFLLNATCFGIVMSSL